MSLFPDVARDEVVVLVGNPKASSRTAAVAGTVGAGLAGDTAAPRVIELCELATRGADDPALRDAQEAVQRAGILVVATPVYKAGYTGLLKSFLDGLEHTALESTVAVPVVLTASSAHGALADLQLRVVLQALGALLPVPSFVLEEHHLDDLPQYVDAWQRRFGTAVTAVVRALADAEVRV
jgi:FMN reductase